MTSPTRAERGRRLLELHESGEAFIIANAWDAASARILAATGFPALATSSGAASAILGKRDHEMTMGESLANARLICEATDLPVSGDLEDGFGDTPADVADCIHAAAEAGLVGGSIQDTTRDSEKPLHDFDFAVQRVGAAVEAARRLDFPFVVVGRTENHLRGNAELDETIRRLQAFEKAGAAALFAPGLPDIESVRAVCSALERPFNFMVGIRGKSFSVAELTAAGVRRISLAASLYRASMTALAAAAKEVQDQGTFGYAESAMTTAELNEYLSPPS